MGEMMSSSTRKKGFALFFIILALAIPFAMIYYVSTDNYKQRYQQWRKNSDDAGQEMHLKRTAGQIVLRKNDKLLVKRTALVYRGLDKKNILLDLFILDLDTEQSYPMQVSIRDAKKGVTLGGNTFNLVSVNNQYLTLKLMDSSRLQ